MRAPPSPSSPLSPLAVYSHWSRTPLPPPPPITPTPPRRLVLLLLLLLLRSSPPSRLSELSLGYDHPQQHEEATEDHQFEHGKQALAVATVSAANAGPTGVVVVDLSVLWMDTGCACRRAKTRRRKQGRRGEMLRWVGGGGGGRGAFTSHKPCFFSFSDAAAGGGGRAAAQTTHQAKALNQPRPHPPVRPYRKKRVVRRSVLL